MMLRHAHGSEAALRDHGPGAGWAVPARPHSLGSHVDRAQFVARDGETCWAGEVVQSHGSKVRTDLPATLRPAAEHGDAVFADVLGGERAPFHPQPG